MLDILALFWDTAEQVPLQDKNACFLEQVYERVDDIFEETKRKKQAKKYARMLKLDQNCRHVSYETPLSETEGKTLLETLGHDHDHNDAVRAFEQIVDVPNLTEMEHEVLRAFYVENRSLDDIATTHGKQREKVRQLLEKAHRKLRHELNTQKLELT